MCGRFTLTADPETLQQIFALGNSSQTSLAALAEHHARYNIAPSQPVAAITASLEEGRRFEYFQWGLIPSWAKDAKIGYKMINARAETLAEKPSFRTALKRRRCLILADGFYEWQRAGGAKIPMYIQLKTGEPFAFAGLYEFWKPPESEELIKSCTLITTTPNSLMEKIHDRMPVILQPQVYADWLAPGDQPAEAMLALLKPYAAAQMKATQVSPRVNNPRLESPDCIQPA
jgi:putative SOS response-associated peptidase YedK